MRFFFFRLFGIKFFDVPFILFIYFLFFFWREKIFNCNASLKHNKASLSGVTPLASL